jgi:hypothetical protein
MDESTRTNEELARLLGRAISLIGQQRDAMNRLEERVTALEAEAASRRSRPDPVIPEEKGDDQWSGFARQLAALERPLVDGKPPTVGHNPLDPLRVPTGKGRQTHTARGAEAAIAHAERSRPAGKGRVKTARRKLQRLRKQLREAAEDGRNADVDRLQESIDYVTGRINRAVDGFLVDELIPANKAEEKLDD